MPPGFTVHRPLAISLVAAIGLSAGGLIFAVKNAHTPPPAKPEPAAVTKTECRLPVALLTYGIPGVSPEFTAGFVRLPDYSFAADATATVTGMPQDSGDGSPLAPRFYSSALHRWIAKAPPEATVDGRAYVYQRRVPETSGTPTFVLHAYDVETGADRTIWSHRGLIEPLGWDGNRLIVFT